MRIDRCAPRAFTDCAPPCAQRTAHPQRAVDRNLINQSARVAHAKRVRCAPPACPARGCAAVLRATALTPSPESSSCNGQVIWHRACWRPQPCRLRASSAYSTAHCALALHRSRVRCQLRGDHRPAAPVTSSVAATSCASTSSTSVCVASDGNNTTYSNTGIKGGGMATELVLREHLEPDAARGGCDSSRTRQRESSASRARVRHASEPSASRAHEPSVRAERQPSQAGARGAGAAALASRYPCSLPCCYRGRW